MCLCCCVSDGMGYLWPGQRTNSYQGSCRELAQARAMQSGGAAAIEAGESMSITLQPGPEGILMRCIQRAAMAAA